ncbi:ribonuclease BN (tRNA processing enzyme) [Methanohalophilus levihalophilus]|uniref:MBL fold metallo-hydrolase n=1 Tax=Methanohalophilus levihalophilus TaxID=1431282 RepID=UPI001AE2135C|nr:MBL fold metallo-hydrolase [Methanohalophilus levihalophilus]MBP2029531.1 ribonuclease BN (tRNA processing enzyme) [Methanohalophilus levihalophilus]
MKLHFLGTGVGIPQAGRVQSGLLVEPDYSRHFLFDCGAGVLQRLFESGHSPLDIDAIVISHLHLDHVADVLPLLKSRWLCGKTTCRIIGPEGTQEWFDKMFDVYPYLQGHFDLAITEINPDIELDLGWNCKLSCAPGIHSIPSLGYRLEGEGNSLVYSADTEPCESIMELTREADVLVHECSFPLNFEVTNHTTPDMLAPFLKNIDVEKLYLTHLYPHMQGHEEEALEFLRKEFTGEVEIATDLLEIEI